MVFGKHIPRIIYPRVEAEIQWSGKLTGIWCDSLFIVETMRSFFRYVVISVQQLAYAWIHTTVMQFLVGCCVSIVFTRKQIRKCLNLLNRYVSTILASRDLNSDADTLLRHKQHLYLSHLTSCNDLRDLSLRIPSFILSRKRLYIYSPNFLGAAVQIVEIDVSENCRRA